MFNQTASDDSVYSYMEYDNFDRKKLRSHCKCLQGKCKAGPGLEFGRLSSPVTKKKAASPKNKNRVKSLKENHLKDYFESYKKVDSLNNQNIVNSNLDTGEHKDWKDVIVEKHTFDDIVFDNWLNSNWQSQLYQSSKPDSNLVPSFKVNSLKGFLFTLFQRSFYYSSKFVSQTILTSEQIQNRVLEYLRQSDIEYEYNKTGYTYANTWSYRNSLPFNKLNNWIIPNMSRSRIVRQSYHVESDVSIQSDAKEQSSIISENQIDSSSRKLFLRSDCLGRQYCQAGCLLHKKSKRSRSSHTTHTSHSSQITNDNESDELFVNDLSNHRLESSRKSNGYILKRNLNTFSDDEEDNEEQGEDEDEDLPTFKRIKNIFITSISRTSSKKKSSLKNKSSRGYKCLLPLLLLLLVPPFLYYLLYYSSFSSTFVPTQSNLNLNDKEKLWLSSIDTELKRLRNCCEQKNNLNHELIINSLRSEIYLDLKKREDLINTLFIRIGELEDKITGILHQSHSLEQKLVTNDEIEQTVVHRMQTVQSELRKEIEEIKKTAPALESYSCENIDRRIRAALSVYDADKTGLPDFALEPGGGTIVSTRCSETFHPYGVQYSILGFPIWFTSNSPRLVIQPSMAPGECWAFHGSQGRLVIKLSQLIFPTAFTYEHVPKQISREGNIDSAPHLMQARGLFSEQDTEGTILANFSYEDNDEPIQKFDVQSREAKPFQYIELIILSNHGHAEYTCLYRFRVHGKKV